MRRASLPWLALLFLLGMPGLGVLGGGAVAQAEDGPERPRHVVLVILGGGVRAKEMLDPALMPNVAEMAAGGVFVDRLRSDAANGYDASARILTGRADALPAPASRPAYPTLCEYVRGARGLPAEKVWYVSFAGDDELNLAHSSHLEHGAAVGPAVAHGQGAFAQPLHSFLERTGRPDPMTPAAWTLLRGLRAMNRDVAGYRLPEGVLAGLPAAERVERALLEEIDRKALLVRGPAPQDQRAWRAALTVLRVHLPTLLVIRLGQAEQGQASFGAYQDVLRANDRGLARLRRAVQTEAALKDRTLVVVVADLGRNAKPNERGGLDADDESKEHRFVALVAEGPGLRAKRLKGKRRLEDLCPTLGRVLGVPTPGAQGAVWERLLPE